MKKFQHLVFTRFNLKFEKWKKDKNEQTVNDDLWMESRIELFNKFCFPSIKHQTNLNFNWLVFFDESTPKKYREIIDNYRVLSSNFIPIFTTENKFNQDKQKMIDKDTKYLITTRIDNDDAFSKDAIETIQKNFKKQVFEFINFYKGYGFLVNKNRLFFSEHPSNAFITLIEKRKSGSFKTVWCGNHTRLDEIGHIKQISDKRYWIRVIHERNLLNSSGPSFLRKNLRKSLIKTSQFICRREKKWNYLDCFGSSCTKEEYKKANKKFLFLNN
jgi:hypothetical protein